MRVTASAGAPHRGTASHAPLAARKDLEAAGCRMYRIERDGFPGHSVTGKSHDPSVVDLREGRNDGAAENPFRCARTRFSCAKTRVVAVASSDDS
jgi:hypothetical protein